MPFVKFNKRKNKNWVSLSKSIVQSYRENWKIKHKVLSNISSLSDDDAHILNSILKWEKLGKISEIKKPVSAKPYWHIKLFHEAIRQIGISDAIIESWENNYHNEIITLIINRLVDPRSRNSIADSWYKKTCIGTILWQKEVDLYDLYNSLEYISDKQILIEDRLYEKNNKGELKLVIYDITSTYFEGKKCPIAQWWYDRDWNKKWKKIVVVWVIMDESWRPICVEVFPWNTPDTKTVKKKIIELRKRFKIKKVLIVVDRWMNIWCNLNKLERWKDTWKTEKKDKEEYEKVSPELSDLDLSDIDYITALRKTEIRKLSEEKILKLSEVDLFTEEKSIEFIDTEKWYKYVCTYNETLVHKDETIRSRKIEKTKVGLEKVQKSIKSWNIKNRDELLKRVWLRSKKYEVEKFFEIEIDEKEIVFSYKINEETIAEDKKIDGRYVLICTDINVEKKEVIQIYRDKDVIEKWFEIMKDEIDLRPVRVWNEARVRWHIFICFLSLYVKRYMKKQMSELLKNHTWDALLDEMEELSLLEYNYKIGEKKIKYFLLTNETMMQKEIFSRFGLKTELVKECSPV